MTDNNYTPTEAAMLRVLADGQAHTREELHACVPDELSAMSAIHRHISAIRKRLRLSGQTIVCELRNRRHYYRHVVLLDGLSNGGDRA